MTETATHLPDHVFPRLAACQGVLSVPQRLRYFLQHDGAELHTAERISVSLVQQGQRERCFCVITNAPLKSSDDTRRQYQAPGLHDLLAPAKRLYLPVDHADGACRRSTHPAAPAGGG